MSKEDFIWFVKKATTDKKSDAHAELYHCLLKMFVDADTNKDGLVSKSSFSKLINMAFIVPPIQFLVRVSMIRRLAYQTMVPL